MATHTIKFSAATGQTLSVDLFQDSSGDTVVDTAAATERTNKKTEYVANFTDLPLGQYQLIAFDETDAPAASWFFEITDAATSSYVASDRILLQTQAATSVATEAITQIERNDGPLAATLKKETPYVLVNDPTQGDKDNGHVRFNEDGGT